MAAAIASTLKSANHRFGTAILAGRETYEQAQETIEARLVGQLKTRFHHEPIMAYEVLARKGVLSTWTEILVCFEYGSPGGIAWDGSEKMCKNICPGT